MLGRWIRYLFWGPFETSCRKFPLVPLRATVLQPCDRVRIIRVENVVTRAIAAIGGGYDYSVCYVIDDEVLVDSGYPWAARALVKTIRDLGLATRIKTIVNTHAHEDHTGNNDVLLESCRAIAYAHPLAIPEIRHPSDISWYRHFMFGPKAAAEVREVPSVLRTSTCELEIHHMPGHAPGHICLFERSHGWLFSGDLFVSSSLDSQLKEVDGPAWIESLGVAIGLRPRLLFDGHGRVVEGEHEVQTVLQEKQTFLRELERRILIAASHAKPIRQVTREVFRDSGFISKASLGEGWLSLLTASDFSRSHLVESFLRRRLQSSGSGA